MSIRERADRYPRFIAPGASQSGRFIPDKSNIARLLDGYYDWVKEHINGARLVRWRIKVDEAPNLSPNRTIAPYPRTRGLTTTSPSRAFAFVSAGRLDEADL